MEATSTVTDAPVLVMGAGIHGVAIARELLLNGVDVVLIDSQDIASGATSKSSRLIHGGLRYLEYGDVGLVRESLAERRRNLSLAPQFVQPLRLTIPLREQFSGFVGAAVGFFGGKRSSLGRWLAGPSSTRGYWPVRIGLSMYDWLAGPDNLTGSAPVSWDDPEVPQVLRQRYTRGLAYSDAQMLYPERVVLALLADAELIAQVHRRSFQIVTYACLSVDGDHYRVDAAHRATPLRIRPRLVVNAAGAAGDNSLTLLGWPHEPLFGGTKGSHLVTYHPELRQRLRHGGVYAEAADGRPVFVLPFGDGVLIGTTDVPYHGTPSDAIPSDSEVEYLLSLVEDVFGLRLEESDLACSYCGVRPLPSSDASTAGAISRDHHLDWRDGGGRAVVTLVGGKLTTWRAFAEEVTDAVLARLNRPRVADTRERPLPGNDPDLASRFDDPAGRARLADEAGSTVAEVEALWPLLGTRTVDVLCEVRHEVPEPLADSAITRRVVRWMIRQEHATRLEDLVERRLLSVFQKSLSRAHLQELSDILIDCRALSASEQEAELARVEARLVRHYRRAFADGDGGPTMMSR